MRDELEVLPSREGGGGRVLSLDPENAESPPSAYAHFLTPAVDRFVRCHFAPPALGDDHAIELAGSVANPRLVPLRELRRLPPASITVVTECAGNGRALMDPDASGERWRWGAVSAAQWTGTPLRSILELRESAVEVVFTGADGGSYQRSLPRDVAMDPSTLLAWEMNGAPIPARFGGPIRLIVPAWYGMASVKWIARIDAVDEPFRGEFQVNRYVYSPGIPVTRMAIKSTFAELPHWAPSGVPLRISGMAWGGEGVAGVDVEISGTRRPARLVGPALPYAWRRFQLDWVPRSPGRYLLACRATDAGGRSQPDEPQWNPLGYGNNAVQRVEVAVI